MQDITDLPFWRLMSKYDGADLYFTEFFRVTPHYVPEKNILRSIIENPTGRPAVAQIIGNDLDAMARTAKALEKHAVAAIDLNLGCPAPVVYRKCAGGGLLRDLARVDALLAALRDAVEGAFTVKTRIGFESPGEFDALLEVFAKHRLDLLTVHGRTVAEKYGPHVHLDRIAQAVRFLPFPVQANGNVISAASAVETLAQTGAAGLMIGRGAIRNPWIFSQIRDRMAGREVSLPTGRQVLDYISDLYEAVCSPGVPEKAQVQKMKKYMNFLGEGLDDSAAFLHDIRRCATRDEFFSICSRHLDHGRAMPLQP
ncbi:MAG: tRNA-dihydrouridine synthase family protein [Proteobacteria bacterium]|nr:tRNA-dihydrouridine synthase family protein [Pseudomonadota bacterium]